MIVGQRVFLRVLVTQPVVTIADSLRSLDFGLTIEESEIIV